MVDNKKGGGEFDADFEGEDFDDAYFDETVEDADLADVPAEGEEFAEEDFEGEDWAEEELEDPKGKKGKKNKKAKKEKSLTSGDKKKGMSSNTMIIMGAVVLGVGVMLFNLSKPPPGAANGKPVDNFKSLLNVGGIMDGTLFGEKPKDMTEEVDPNADQGFLTKVPEENPPQPNPISPEDTASPDLTPLPEDGSTPSTEAPRGPDDAVPTADGSVPGVPVDAASTPVDPNAPADPNAPVTAEVTPPADGTVPATETPPAETATAETPSAQDILNKAMADRAAEQGGETPPADGAAATTEEKPADAATDATADATKEVVPEIATTETPATEGVKPATETGDAEAVKAAAAAATANAEEVKALESKLDSKIDELLKRMEKIENDLGEVRETKGGDSKEIEDSLQSLKEEVAELKNRPATAAPEKKAKKEAKPEPVEEASEEATPTAAPAPKKAVTPKPAPAAPAVTAGGWELRAAQPGRAWVSPQGSRDMQSVVVGDTLKGIGKVTGIVYQNGQWTVQGTTGAIHQ